MSKQHRINLNRVDNSDCPCKDCINRYAGCHSRCVRYIDWNQLHAIKILKVKQEQAASTAFYEGSVRRSESLGRRSLNIGRGKKGKWSGDTGIGS